MAARPRHVWLVGGGISALAAAALLVRESGMPGDRIHVLEQAPVLGGSLDGSGDPERGYLVRGGRMFEPHFGCTYDLFRSIPAVDDPGVSVTDQVHAFSRRFVPSSRCRLVRGGRPVEAPALGLALRERLDLLRLTRIPEATLGDRTIEAWFRPRFLGTDFWLMWSTMFAFQPWHGVVELRRYARRFMHLLPGFARLQGIQRTPLNQYDALIAPLERWLRSRGVDIRTGVRVVDLAFEGTDVPARVTGILAERSGSPLGIGVGPDDRVFVTLGSMTAGSSTGDWDRAPVPVPGRPPDWALWDRLARRSPVFGRPGAFAGDVRRSRWTSFTVTLRDPAFFAWMDRFTGSRDGTGGLVTLADSSWRLSIVLPRQPHFRDQPDDVQVFWGYALFPDATGDHVRKPMDTCSGGEIVREVFHHLGLGAQFGSWCRGARCVPCRMPYITSQFMPRRPGDRPRVVPAPALNYACLGQFCELPDDTVFTVEYSVRSAWTAVQESVGAARGPMPLYRGCEDPGVQLRALRTLLTT